MQNGLESIPTVKDAHSPSGQPFVAFKSFADLPDCPICKFGTPVLRQDRWVCIDCRCDVTAQMVDRGGIGSLLNDRLTDRSADSREFPQKLKQNKVTQKITDFPL